MNEPMTRARQIREEFDRGFAEPIRAAETDALGLLGISLGGDPYGIRLTEIAGLYADVAITAVPSPIPELLGVAGFRGVLTPVYDLAALLGYAGGGGRWMILSAARDVAFSFDTFNDHFRISAKSLAGQQGTAATRHVGEVAHAGGRPLPLISIPSVVAAITARATGRTLPEGA